MAVKSFGMRWGEFFELKNGLWNKQIIFPFDVILMIDDYVQSLGPISFPR